MRRVKRRRRLRIAALAVTLAALAALATPQAASAKLITWNLTGLVGGGGSKIVTQDGQDLTVNAYGILDDSGAASNSFAAGTLTGGAAGLGVNFLNGGNLDNRRGDVDLMLFKLPAKGRTIQLGFNRHDAGDQVRVYVGGGVSPAGFTGLSYNALDSLVLSGDLQVADFGLSNAPGVLTIDLDIAFGAAVVGRYVIVTVPYAGTSDEFRLAAVTADVPEPPAIALFLVALGALLGFGRSGPIAGFARVKAERPRSR